MSGVGWGESEPLLPRKEGGNARAHEVAGGERKEEKRKKPKQKRGAELGEGKR